MSFREWEEVKLKDIISFNPKETIKKGTISKKIGMDKLSPFQRKIEGYELVRFTSGTKFRNGDTLLARITPCLENGKTAQVTILNKDEVAFGSTEYIVMREKDAKSINDFIFYLAISPKLRDIAIKSMTGTSGRQRAQKNMIEDTIIKVPPINEQKSIAHILSTLDEKIEVNNQINKTLEKIAQAIFKQWFVDFEFPDEEGELYQSSGGEMVESELGLIPKGWEIKQLIDIASNIITGKTPSTKEKSNFDGNIPFVKIPDMHGKTYITSTESFLSELGAVSNKNIPKNSVIVSCIATPGLVSLAAEDCQTNQQINTIICQNMEMCYFTYFLLKSLSDFIRTLGSSGSTTLNLNKGVFSKIKAVIPPLALINTYYQLVESSFQTILNNQKMNIKLTYIRDALLPKLMSGEIRVPLDSDGEAS